LEPGGAERSALTRELLYARRYAGGAKQYMKWTQSLEQRKERVKLLVRALDCPQLHSARALEGNEYALGPFYKYHPPNEAAVDALLLRHGQRGAPYADATAAQSAPAQ
jgi:hypothetical protein